MMNFRNRRMSRRLHPPLEEEDNSLPFDLASNNSKTLHLGAVHPGPFVRWGHVDKSNEDPLWVVNIDPSKLVPGSEHQHQDDEEDADSGEELGHRSHARDDDAFAEFGDATGRVSSEDDPDHFLMEIKRDLDLQRQMLRLLQLAHKKARAEWAKTPFKLTGLEGRGEAEVLKVLFLVADQPLEDDRITAEQVEELKGQTPYGEFPIISKCGATFGDASAISRALATKFQLYGETVQEQLVVGAIYSRLRRLEEKHKRTLAWVMCGQVKDKAKIEWAQGQVLHVILPPVIKEWDQQIRSTSGPFFVESGMTLADVAIMNFLDQCSSHVMIDGLLADHLAVSDMMDAIKSCPRLLAHLQNLEEE